MRCHFTVVTFTMQTEQLVKNGEGAGDLRVLLIQRCTQTICRRIRKGPLFKANNLMKKTCLYSLLLCCQISFWGRVAAEETVKIGVLHSLTGTMAISETSLRDVVLMAVEEINAAGGVLGKKIVPEV